METVTRIITLSQPPRQPLKSLISRVQTPASSLPLALQPHPGLMHAFALLQRLLGYVDSQLVEYTHHFLLECPPQFRDMRTPRQLGRLLAAAAILRRGLNVAIARQPEERHIRIGFSRLKVHFPFESKQVVGVLVIFNSSCICEAFGRNHFAGAVQAVIGDCKPLNLSFVHQVSLTEGQVMAYLEFEREGGFASADIQLLRARLAEEIREHIQPLEPHIYCQRNEEEVYRNAIILCHELRTIHDIPQVMINYEQLEGEDLVFVVVLARPHTMGTASLLQLWRTTYPSLAFISERTTYLDQFQGGERKEISIFKLFIPQKNFRRKNCSIDVNAARRFIEQALKEILGDIRDYNGGLILKQHENRERFLDLADNPKSRSWMESFFLSIQPLAMQGTMLLEILQRWYSLVKETISLPIRERSAFSLAIHDEEGWLILSAQVSEPSALPILEEALRELNLASYEKATSWIQENGTCIFSCAYLTYDRTARKAFLSKIEKTLRIWEAKILSRQHLRMNLRNLPHLLDPRLTRNDSSISLVRMLFEGLLRKTPSGELQFAIAESVQTSSDGKTYTFFLRETQWSNGEKLTAHDVEYSWKRALDSRLHSLFAYNFYVIKNAKAAHQGLVTPKAIGVHAIDDRTLRVELETPNPRFLESTAHWTYSIIPAEIDRSDPGWAYEEGQRYICNGPFLLHKRRPGQAIILSKNPYYWDASTVKLEKITVHTVQDPLIEKEMFLKGEIDLLSESASHLIHDKECKTLAFPFFSIIYLQCNTRRFPFNNEKIRLALQQILWHYRMRLSEESGLKWEGIAFSLSQEENSFPPLAIETSLSRALALFAEGLAEVASNPEDLHKINLLSMIPMLEKLTHSIGRLLREVLGIGVEVHKNGQMSYFKKLADGQYHLGLGIWDACLHDPMSTDDCFVPLFRKKAIYCKKSYVQGDLLTGNNEIDLKWTYLQ